MPRLRVAGAAGLRVPIRVHHREVGAHVHLGRRKPHPEPLGAFRDGTVRVQADEVFELAEALSRIVFGRPFF